MLAIGLTGHLDIHPGSERQPCGVGRRGGNALRAQFPDSIEITDQQAGKPPLFAQQTGQQGGMAVHGTAGQLVEGRHDCIDTGRDGGLEGR